MKKLLLTMLFVVTFFSVSTVSASAVVNNTVKVGLWYGSDALYSANLENHVGSGYSFGYFDSNRNFVPVGETSETTISMTAAGTIYMNSSGTYSAEVPTGSSTTMGAWRIQINGFQDYYTAAAAAAELGGWPAWIGQEYVVRMGCFNSQNEAQSALNSYLVSIAPPVEEPVDEVPVDEVPSEEDAPMEGEVIEDTAEPVAEGERGAAGELEQTVTSMSSLPANAAYSVVQCSSTGIVVTKTRTANILFEYDCWGIWSLGVMPNGQGSKAVTWFKGYRYYGGFEYSRITGGNINVCNVVGLEDYVKGVISYEMSSSWNLEALKAQAVCARTYVSAASKHLSSYGFDVCNTTDCQVYYGVNKATTTTDQAVELTQGQCLYYNSKLASSAVYHSSNGGATEDAKNVWGSSVQYLIGKEDPYEALVSIPNYTWEVTYTASELTWILQQKGYSIGTVKNVYVSEYTDMGNVKKVTFVGSGGTKTVSGDTCRTIFYSSTYNKSVKSMRFGINGSGPVTGQEICVNDSTNVFSTMNGISVISGSGEVVTMDGSPVTVITANGTEEVKSDGYINQSASTSSTSGTFVIKGSGSGHNVGMSQYGAKAMADNGYKYKDILAFYYTGASVY